jgi:tRNA 2-thiocytidine biosynthesis protein TtcA
MAKTKTLSKYQTKHIEFVKNKLAKAVMDYKMIANGDKVLVAVSGGKDSLVLLEALSAFKNFKLVDFDIEAIHINVKDVSYEVNRDFLFSFAESLGVKMNIVDIETDLENRDKKSPCFVCSWHRRKTLFTFANENGFKRLALGHHMDDAVETLLINMTYHANISSMPGKLQMFKGELDLIRPLILLTNKDTTEFSNIRQYPKLKAECPFEDKTRRTTARRLIKELEAINKDAKRNIFKSLSNIDLEYLP